MGDGRMKTTHIIGSNVECRQHSVDIGTHKSASALHHRACCSIHLKHKFHVIRRLHGCPLADNFIYRHIL